MDEPNRTEYLRDEYLQLQKIIEDLDGRVLTIKAWSVSFGLATVAGAFISHRREVFVLASLASLCFWFLEVLWKSFQQVFYKRIEQIEGYFAGGPTALPPFQIKASWYKSWKDLKAGFYFRMSFWPHVCLPHVFVMVVALLMLLLCISGHLKLA